MEKHVNVLADAVKAEFQKKAAKLQFGANPSATDLIDAAKSLVPVLMKDESFALKSKALYEGKHSFLTYLNLPDDRGLLLPPTNGKRPDSKPSWVSEMVLLSVTMLSGYCPFSFREEKGEELIHQIAPSVGKEGTISNGGMVPLPWHTDDSILPEMFRPSMLMLIGLVNENLQPTSICMVDDALNKMGSEQLSILSGDNYRIQTPDSFDDALKGMKIQSAWKPIIKLDSNGLIRAGGNLFALTPRNPEARHALDLLQHELTLNETSVMLQSGSALQFDNSRCFHRRGKLSAGKRWLQRVFAISDIEAMRKALGVDSTTHIFDAYKLILQELYST